MASVAITHKDSILERIQQGHRITDIAKSLGVSQPAISQVLAHDPEFIAARECGANARMEFWEGQTEAISPDDAPVMLARAREMLSHSRWRAEREFPHRWGAKQQIEHSGSVTLEHVRKSDLGAIIDAACCSDETLRITDVMSSAETQQSCNYRATIEHDDGISEQAGRTPGESAP